MADLFYHTTAWLNARYKALVRAKGFCQCCGTRGTPENPLQCDHIKPRSRYPALELHPDNLQILCHDCNAGKSDRDCTDWRWVPVTEMEIWKQTPPAVRAELLRLGWHKLHAASRDARIEAARAYRKLWRELETAWIEGNTDAKREDHDAGPDQRRLGAARAGMELG